MTDSDVLAQLRLTSGEPVRFRKVEGGRWLPGKMSGVASDGSITIHDANGAARSFAAGACRSAPARQSAAG